MKRKRGENVNNNFEGLQPERKKNNVILDTKKQPQTVVSTQTKFYQEENENFYRK